MKILLIEDDAGLIELITSNLEELGFSIMNAASGDEALKYLEKQTPDLMLLDYSLPDINGKELIEILIKQYNTPPPFIITTGQGDERIAVDMMKLGAMDYLVKDILFLERLPGVVMRVVKEIESEGKLRKAEEALKQSEQRFRMISENAPVLINSFNEDGRCVFWNKRCKKTFGWTIEEINEQEVAMALFYPDPVVCEKVIRTTTSDPDRSFKEWHPVTKDGKILSIMWANFSLPGGQVFSLGHDITERKQAEEQLRISEKRSRAYLENSPACTKIVDMDFNLQFISRAGITGLHIDDVNEYYGKPYPFSFYPDSFKNQMTQNLKRAKKTGEIIVQEAPVVDVDGDELWFQSTIVPVKDDDDLLEYLMVVSMDTTERKQAEQALRESEENLSIILNSIGEAVIAVNREGKITQMNPVAEELTGWTFEDAKTRSLSEVFKTTNALTGETSLNPVERVIKSGAFIGLANHTILKSRDGVERQIADSVAPIKNPKGEIIGVVLVFRDVTEQYRLEARVHQSEKMQAVGQLAGGIAHDFNNQLSAILGYSELLIRRLKDEQQIKDATHIKEGALRAANLTAQLLAFSHKGKSLSTPVSIHKIISEVTDILEHSINKQITIQQILNATPEVTLGDPNQLQNAILNMALNARDAMPDGGKLIFETAVTTLDKNFLQEHVYDILPGRYLMIRISDNGCGMDAETQKHIFEPFYTTKDVGKGTGMGLASVYGTIHNHNGEIRVHSQVGKGTTFYIYLPLIEGTHSPEVDENNNKPVTGTARILLVDDEKTIRTFATRALETLGYQTFSCSDGKEAVEYYEKSWREIDLVLLDMIMPVMGGREAFAYMKKINPDILAILTSGYSLNEAAQAILDDGVKAFIRKPYQLVELSEKVALVLQGEAEESDG